jgi:hypothetical protein
MTIINIEVTMGPEGLDERALGDALTAALRGGVKDLQDRLAGLEHAVDDLLASRVTWKISIREAQPVHSEELSQ